MPNPSTTSIQDLTALRAQLLNNSDILYKTRPNKSIIVTGRTLLTAHLLGSFDPADVLVSGNPYTEVAEAYASLLRETAFRLNEVVVRAQKARVAGGGKEQGVGLAKKG